MTLIRRAHTPRRSRARGPRGVQAFCAATLGLALVTACGVSQTTLPSNEAAHSEPAALSGNKYVQTNLVANDADAKAQFSVNDLINAWGLANRPKGSGGHFWIGAGGKSFEFVGDVQKSPDPQLRKLFQDPLHFVTIP